MIKVALVQPYVNDENLTPPLGILYIAAFLEEEGHKVKIFDQRIKLDILNDILEFNPDIVGFTCVTGAYNQGLQLSRQIKGERPSTIIVFGGPHPTALPEDVVKEQSIDFVIVNEGEIPMRDLCQEILPWKKKEKPRANYQAINNIYYKENGNFLNTSLRNYLTPKGLDKLPYPAWDLIDVEKYFHPGRSYGLFVKSHRNLPVLLSRGCPNTCTYCCRVMGQKFRPRSWQKAIEEIQYIVTRFKLKEVHIIDDNFTFDKERAIKILDEIKKLNLGIYIKFSNGIRADKVDFELLKKMKEAGCYTVAFGIESGSSRTLNMMKKNLSLEKVKESVNLAKNLGFLVSGNCIIGYPGETMQDINESLDFFKSLKLDSMAIAPLVPFPGTEVRKICEEKGYLTENAIDWNNYVFALNDPVPLISTEYLTSTDIRKIIKQTYRSFYLQPSRIYTILRNVSSLKKLITGMKIMMRSFKN